MTTAIQEERVYVPSQSKEESHAVKPVENWGQELVKGYRLLLTDLLLPHGLFNLRSYRTLDDQLSSVPTSVGWASPKKSLIQKMAYGLALLQHDLMQAIFHLGSLLSDDFSLYQAAIKTARITTQKCSHSPSFNQRKTIPAS